MIMEERESSGGQANLPPPDIIPLNKVILSWKKTKIKCF